MADDQDNVPAQQADGHRTRSRMRSAIQRLRGELVGRFSPGDGLPSQDSLAAQLGVSRPSVRKMLDSLMREGWLTRPPHGYGYVVTRPKRTLPAISGLMFPFSADTLFRSVFYRDIAAGFGAEAQRHGRLVATFLGGGRGLQRLAGAHSLQPDVRLVDSLASLEIFDRSLLDQLAAVGPLVCLDHQPDLPGVSSVVFDHRLSIRMAFKYLLDLGHRRIGYMGRGVSTDPSTTMRLESYRDCFPWSGLAANPGWEMLYSERDVDAQLNKLVEQFQATPAADRLTAIIAVDCLWSVVPILLHHGLRLPEQLSVVTVGEVVTWSNAFELITTVEEPLGLVGTVGIDYSSPFSNRPEALARIRPSTVRLPARKMGQLGMAELIRRVADPAAEPDHILLDAELVHGDTATVARA